MTGVHPEVFLFGAGGHAKVVVDVFRRAGIGVAACLSSSEPAPGENVDGVPVLREHPGLETMRDAGHVHAFVAIGDNSARRRVALEARASGLELLSAISPTATIAPDAVIGTGTLVVHGAVVNAAARIGDDVIVNTGATVDHDDVIGDGAHIAPGCHLAGTVHIGARAMLGIGTVVIPGITVGDDAVVGAGSVVIRDVAAGTRVWGNPARPAASGADADVSASASDDAGASANTSTSTSTSTTTTDEARNPTA